MLRALLAALAVALLLGVLSLLTIESRSVTEEYYVAHADRLRAIETSRDDLLAVTQGAQSVFAEGRAIPEAVDLAFVRLGENNDRLQSMSDTLRPESAVHPALAGYNAALDGFVANGEAFAIRQNALAEALRTLQEESPIVVKDLRRFNLRIQSQNTFTLAIEIIEFATGQRNSGVESMQTRIDALRNDSAVDRQVPGRLDDFLNAAQRVIAERQAAEVALAAISESTISAQLGVLSDTLQAENRRTVNRAERARLLLSVCALLILAGAGYAMWKLQSSYRELARVNNSLEDRVSTRTRELSGAYDDLKESQVQLVQAEKMSSLGELVAGISHEINTPLYYLTSNTTIVQDRLVSVKEFFDIAETMIAAVAARENVKETVSKGLLDMRTMLSDGMRDDVDEAQDLIKDSIEGLEELTELAQSLKDFSRLDRSKQGEFNVNDGLDKTLLIAKNRIKNKVTVHKHYGEVPSVLCSPSQINQIFLNLITNAADAIETTGELVLRTWEEDDHVCVSVSDTGSGIPEEILSKIRDPFFTTKEVGKGTGLGLSIVDQIISSHKGELKFDSKPGKGTVVTMRLPINPPEDEESEASADLNKELDHDLTADALSDDVAELSAGVEAANEIGVDEEIDTAEPEEATA